MQFIIHKGSQEIGGSCVEVFTKSTRILVDFGMPLLDIHNDFEDKNPFETLPITDLVQQVRLPNIKGLYNDDQNAIDGILISHAHPDHYGLIAFARNEIPFYSGEATHEIIELSQICKTGKSLPKTFHYFTAEEPFSIGDITITPYLMDHSAFDAYAFLIEADGKRIFYSGDFRGHGRKKALFTRLIKTPPKDVDYLLMEGTTIGRVKKDIPSEQDIEFDLVQVFKERKGLNVLLTSTKNIDRLVSIYKACKRSGKIMVIDPYTALILKRLNKYAQLPFTSTEYPLIKVYFATYISSQIRTGFGDDEFFSLSNFKISRDEILQNHLNCVLLIKTSMAYDLSKFQYYELATCIYSLWSGYKKKAVLANLIRNLQITGFALKEIHTSGHASISALNCLAQAIPPKFLVPIHTEKPKSYRQLFQGVRIKEIKDRETITIE